jgi:hypothetical protein
MYALAAHQDEWPRLTVPMQIGDWMEQVREIALDEIACPRGDYHSFLLDVIDAHT